MGLFDAKTKKDLEEKELELKRLEQELQEKKILVEELKTEVHTYALKEKELELLIQELKYDNTRYKELLADEEGNLISAKALINEMGNKAECLEEKIIELEHNIEEKHVELTGLEEEYIVMDEAVLLQSFGVYTPKYSFVTAAEYKDKLKEIRDKQKEMIKAEKAAICAKVWSVEGSVAKGRKLVGDNVKQVLRTFNTECDNVINIVKFSNYDTVKKRIKKSFDTLNKLNRVNQIEIQESYLELKYNELDLAFEYAKKVQEEKEENRRQRELRREEEKLIRELEEKREEIEKEQQHYLNEMNRLKEQIEVETNSQRLIYLKEKESEILKGLVDVDTALKDLDYRQANYRAGYVYIISNLGAFGKDVYKIGMTRRLDPQDRVDELGGASVPFRFDVHAFIFSNDAPKLETALHQAFESRKVNVVNGRKEFFKVTLEEIAEVVKKNHDKSIDFKEYPEAEQYRESVKIREMI
ncbi:MAG: DUF4041 domain-containing protein [Eubacteriales bacterium]